MPVRPRKGIQRKGMLPDQRYHLLNDVCFGFDGHGFYPFKDDEERKALWIAHREELMAEMHVPYRDRISFVGLERFRIRPSGWWDYEAPQRPKKYIRDYHKAEFDLLRNLGMVTEEDVKRYNEIEKDENVAPLYDSSDEELEALFSLDGVRSPRKKTRRMP